MRLSISHGVILGEGTDADGRFNLDGLYESADVVLTRCYTWTTEPSQSGVGIRYTYRGTWDGAMVSGRWFPYDQPWIGGPFEMWPQQEETRSEFAQLENELALSGPSR